MTVKSNYNNITFVCEVNYITKCHIINSYSGMGVDMPFPKLATHVGMHDEKELSMEQQDKLACYLVLLVVSMMLLEHKLLTDHMPYLMVSV